MRYTILIHNEPVFETDDYDEAKKSYNSLYDQNKESIRFVELRGTQSREITFRDKELAECKKEFIEKWDQDNPICIRCGRSVTEGWGHECLYYDCENCGLFFYNEDVYELRSSIAKARKDE